MTHRTDMTHIFKGIIVDTEYYIVKKDNHSVWLTRREFELLKLLLENKNRYFSIDKIIECLWPCSDRADHTIMDIISRIRGKLGKEVIKSKWGCGFGVIEQ